jgi:glucokinase
MGEGATQDSFYVLAFDVGGTNTVAALAHPGGDLLAEIHTPTVRYDAQPGYAGVFTGLRDELVRRAGVQPVRVRAAGISVAGIIDPGTERVVMAPNLTNRDFDLRAIVGDALGVPVAIENDVNLAAVGEHWRGVARGCANFIFVAIGTGIGGGVFINGQLYRGTHNAAGEVGHMYVHGIERMAPGGLGVLEKRAAGPGLATAARRRLQAGGAESSLLGPDSPSLRAEDVWSAALQGDALAAEAVSEMLDTLALGLANAAFMVDPEMIVLGGGVSRVGDALLVPLRERLHTLLTHPLAPVLKITDLGAHAQLYGAIRLALRLAGSQAG